MHYVDIYESKLCFIQTTNALKLKQRLLVTSECWRSSLAWASGKYRWYMFSCYYKSFHFIFCLHNDVDSFSFHLHFDGFQHNQWYSILHSLLERLSLLGACLPLMNVRSLWNKLKQVHYTEIHSPTHFTLASLFWVQPTASISLFKDHGWSQIEVEQNLFWL